MAYNEHKELLKTDYQKSATPEDIGFRRFSADEIEARHIRKEGECIAKAENDPDVVNKGRDPMIVGSVDYMLG